VQDYNAGQLTGDRKLLKHIRRGDVFGLYAADRAIEQAGFAAWRATLDEAGAEAFADGNGVVRRLRRRQLRQRSTTTSR